MTEQEKAAHVKALVVRLEELANKHGPKILVALVAGQAPSMLALAMLEAYELGAIAERQRIAGNMVGGIVEILTRKIPS